MLQPNLELVAPTYSYNFVYYYTDAPDTDVEAPNEMIAIAPLNAETYDSFSIAQKEKK